MQDNHNPVLLSEVLEEIAHLKSQSHNQPIIVDATLGLGGHSEAFIKEGCFVIGIDFDQISIERSEERLSKACPASNTHSKPFILKKANFKDIDQVLEESEVKTVDAVLFDLGVNTPQLVSETRGLSFQNPDAPLDMRLSPDTQSVTAADLLNSLPQSQLELLFGEVCEYKETKYLSKKVVETRSSRHFEKMKDFLSLFRAKRAGELHPATKALMALRMAVNSERENLEESLPKAFEVLAKGGKLMVISFHSGEDRRVKDFMKQLAQSGKAEISHKPIVPTQEEIRTNPPSRSAKLRIATKL